MPSFYFHMIGPKGRLEDFEGSDLLDLNVARQEAIKDARTLMSEAILKGKDISGGYIEICDREGRVLLVLPFTDAITGRQ
jgi:hypothetical protein